MSVMPGGNSIENLEKRLDAGSESAAGDLFRRYVTDLISLASERIEPRHRSKFDADDVVQSALRSFFVRRREGQFELTSWDGLWGLLVRITLRKCGRTAAFWDAARRDAAKEHTLESAATASRDQAWQAYEPKTHEALSLRETLEAICDDLTDTQQQIFLLDLEGRTAAEVSQRIDRSIRTVRRTLAEIRRGLKRHAEEQPSRTGGADDAGA